MTVKILTDHQLEFLNLKGGGTRLSESTLVKMPYCWKSQVPAHLFSVYLKTIDCLNIELLRIYWQYFSILQVLKFEFLNFMILEVLNRTFTQSSFT